MQSAFSTSRLPSAFLVPARPAGQARTFPTATGVLEGAMASAGSFGLGASVPAAFLADYYAQHPELLQQSGQPSGGPAPAPAAPSATDFQPQGPQAQGQNQQGVDLGGSLLPDQLGGSLASAPASSSRTTTYVVGGIALAAVIGVVAYVATRRR